MKRRRVIASVPLTLFVPSWGSQGTQPAVKDMVGALQWLDALAASPEAKTTSGWPLPQLLEHLAQSIEYSVRGFPESKSAWFQNTFGAAAFGLFKWRGKMSHGLTEPIPGAPALAANDRAAASARLRAAILAFDATALPLKPHFAYGALSKADYALAHAFHIANHQDLISFT